MALSPQFLDELRARTPLSALVGRRVKLSRSGRNWKGCCPFHGEKSPSFHVYEDHFHCFGCGAHGDAISFTMQSGGASFMEAVEQLASEAGLEVPKPTPQAAEAERRRLDLHEVLEAAQASFARRLQGAEGGAGLAYLRGRGLTDDTIARFGLGWSGEGRGGLIAELGSKGIDPARMLEAGLLRETDEGGAPREALFNRVTFPIRDRKGRLISFGGRTLGDAKPKYVNGPETALFSKKRNLYALDLARKSARQKGQRNRLIVVEGYMDVIALHQAGFGGAVAPLGTALTQEQLEELWRLFSDPPVLCFDGDSAGARAVAHVANMVLPQITADRTLFIARLPENEDPDSLIHKQGPEIFDAILDKARPLDELLFGILGEGAKIDTPEGQSALRTKLVKAADNIQDFGLRARYREKLLKDFKNEIARFYEERRGAGKRRSEPRGAYRLAKPVPLLRAPVIPDATQVERARCLCAILLRHPSLVHDVEEAFAGLDLPAWLSRVREEVLQWAETAVVLDSAHLITHLGSSGLVAEAAQVLAATPWPLPECARADAMPAEALFGWWHLFGLLNYECLDEEIEIARREMAIRCDEASQRKLVALCNARLELSALEAELE